MKFCNVTVAESLVEFNKEAIQVTSSFGVSRALVEVGEDRYSIQQLIREADQALYAVKNKGSNCVTLYSSDELLFQI